MHRFNFTHLLLMFLLASSLILVPSCTEESDPVQTEPGLVKDYDATVPLEWNKLFLEIDRYSPGYRPPAAARMLAYTGLAVYESAVPGMPEYNSLKYEFPGLDLPSIASGKPYHWPTAISTAYASMFKQLTRLFPFVSFCNILAVNDFGESIAFDNSSMPILWSTELFWARYMMARNAYSVDLENMVRHLRAK